MLFTINRKRCQWVSEGRTGTIYREALPLTITQHPSSFLVKIRLFSGLSLALKKHVCDWLRQTLNPSELKASDPSSSELIHTSCRSESSNISLVVLDNGNTYAKSHYSALIAKGPILAVLHVVIYRNLFHCFIHLFTTQKHHTNARKFQKIVLLCHFKLLQGKLLSIIGTTGSAT